MSPGSFRIAWVHSGAPRGRRIYSGSRAITRVRLGVVQSGAHSGRRVRLGLHRVHRGDVFIRLRVGSLCARSVCRVHSGSHGFTPALLGVTGFIRVWVGSLAGA